MKNKIKLALVLIFITTLSYAQNKAFVIEVSHSRSYIREGIYTKWQEDKLIFIFEENKMIIADKNGFILTDSVIHHKVEGTKFFLRTLSDVYMIIYFEKSLLAILMEDQIQEFYIKKITY